VSLIEGGGPLACPGQVVAGIPNGVLRASESDLETC